MRKTKIGIVGIGAISGIYLENITNMFEEIEIIGVCDLIRERAEKAVEEYKIPKLYNDMYELFKDPEVDIVLNLTRPYEHYNVTMEALKAGKHVYSEKPLAASLQEGKDIIALSKEKGLRVGGAPDTFLGAGIQTCRKLIEDGYIGTPVGAAGFMICRGHESWHPDPEFYYKYGGGPLFDMGPYYLTALVNLLGGVNDVYAMSKKSFPKRMITSKEHFGEVIDVDVDTYIAGSMRFESGAIGTLFTTFDVHYESQSRLEIYGSEGTLYVPDPNFFSGTIKLFRPEEGVVKEVPLVFPYKDNSRALGLADMAKAINTDRNHRANSDMTYHVLEIMEGLLESGKQNKQIEIKSKFNKEPQMDRTGVFGILD